MYTVYADDIFHLYESEYRRTCGEYATYEEAVEKCRQAIRDYVDQFPTKNELYKHHAFYGDDFWITPEPEGKHFSSSTFMEEYIKAKNL